MLNNVEIIKFGIKYFLTVILRSNHNRSKQVAPIYNFIETAIANNVIIALFVAELFTYEHIVTEMLMKVPLITFETTIATLLNTSVKRLYEFEKDSIADYCKVIQETDEEGQLKMKSNVKQALKEYLQVSNSAEGAQQKWTLCKPMLNDFQEITPEDLAVILDQPQESDGEGEEEEEESESESENDAEKQQLAQALSQSAKDAEQQNEPEVSHYFLYFRRKC